jgi:hypothetical protein
MILPWGVQNGRWKMKCLTYIGKHIKVTYLNTNCYWGGGWCMDAKHDSEARIACSKMVDPINVKVCMFVQES